MRNVMEATKFAPTVTLEAVTGGDVAVFTDPTFFGAFADGGQEALHSTLSLAQQQVEEALMSTQVEDLTPGVSEWRMLINVEEDGSVNIPKLFLSKMLQQAQNWESVILMVASAITVLLAKTVVFV